MENWKRLLKRERFICSRHQHLSRQKNCPCAKEYSILEHWPEDRDLLGFSLGTEARAGSILTSPSALLKLAGTILFNCRFYSKFFLVNGTSHFNWQALSLCFWSALQTWQAPSFIFPFSRCQLCCPSLHTPQIQCLPEGGSYTCLVLPLLCLSALVCGTVTKETLKLTGSGGCEGLCTQVLQDYNQQRKIFQITHTLRA